MLLFLIGFRKDPYARRITLTGAVSSKLKWEAKLDTDFRWENSRMHRTMLLKASTLDVVHFYGFGNDTRRIEKDEFYEIDRWELLLEPALSLQFGKKAKVPAGPLAYRRQTSASMGITARYSSTKELEGTIIVLDPDLYGTGRFGQVGGFIQFKHDNRDIGTFPTKGSTLNLMGTFYPNAWDVQLSYGWINANGSVYFSAPVPFEPVLAFHAGGKKIWGDFPYFDAAFIGGSESIRGFDKERFAGDLSFYGGSDLRLLVAEPRILMVSHFGVFGFADAGRVYLDGGSPGGLHWGYGGGIWLSLLGRPNTASLALANSDEGVKIYVAWGFSF